MEGAAIEKRTRELKAERYGGAATDPPSFIFADPPEHGEYRRLTSKKFTPKAMDLLQSHFDELTEMYVAQFAQILAERFPEGDSVDFVHELACKLPVAVICEIAGVPHEDWEQVFRWTEVLVGANDPEFQF